MLYPCRSQRRNIVMKKEVEFPHIISAELPKGKKLSVLPEVAKKLHQISMKGHVSADGKWVTDPGGFFIVKEKIGVYKIIHNLGYANTSLSVSLVTPPGTLVVKEHSPTQFVVECSLDKKSTDMEWVFTLLRVI